MKKFFSVFVVLVWMFLFASPVEARNPNLSNWLENISESDFETEPKNPDYAPEIEVEGNTVHVVWASMKADFSASQLYYRRSINNGTTWEPKMLLTEWPGQSGISPTDRKMVVHNDYVHIFLKRLNSSHITYFRSTDGGATFENERNLTPDSEIWDRVIVVSYEGKLVVLYKAKVYQDNREKTAIGVMISTDNGVTFYPRHVATLDLHPQFVGAYDVQVDGNKIYVLYGTFPNYGTSYLYFAKSLDGGNSFQSQKLNPLKEDGTYYSCYAGHAGKYEPKIAFSGSKVYVAFHCAERSDLISGPRYGVYFRRSLDNGTTFSDATRLSDGLELMYEQSGTETIAAKGENVYLVFASAYGDAIKLYFKRSINSGESFEALKELTSGGYFHLSFASTPTYSSDHPVIKIDPTDPTGSTIHVLGRKFLYVYSKDAGVNFSGPVLLFPFAESTPSVNYPRVAIGIDGRIHAVGNGICAYNGAGYNCYGLDNDIFYRNFKPEVEQANQVGNKALRLERRPYKGECPENQRYDLMQIASTPDLEFASNMTIEAWVKPTRGEENPWYGFDILYKYDGTVSIWVAAVDRGVSGITYNPRAKIKTTNGEYLVEASDFSMPNNKWTHIAVTYDANVVENNFKLYVNGNLASQTTASGTLLTNQRAPYVVGDFSTNSGLQTDIIIVDELRFWNRTLTEDEIRYNMMRFLTGTESGLVAYYNFNEPISVFGTIRDITGRGHTGYLIGKESLVESDNVFYTLSVTKYGSGSGTVSSNPSGISCGSDCSESYPANTSVTLMAAPASGSTFGGWGGDCSFCGTNSTCQITMDSNKVCAASFNSGSELVLWHTAGIGDFNGDGKSDILWRNISTGMVTMWLMNGSSITSWATILGGGNTDWMIAGAGDFNGDEKADILWRNTSTGMVTMWLMNGTTITNWATILGTGNTAWTVAGTGDFNGDGKSDILWRNSSTGMVTMWLMNGTTITNWATILGTGNTAWTVAGTGDFNGDGKSDILWRNSSTGMVTMWLMNGTTITNWATILGTGNTAWTVAGTGDFNGDGKSDIIWQNSSTGMTVMWIMNGTSITNWAVLAGAGNQAWNTAGTGKFDNDSNFDILWRNSSTGMATMWFMNGTSIKSWGIVVQ